MITKIQRRPRATWIPGKAQNYESLWILFNKFLILNVPTREDIAEIFRHQAAPMSYTSLGPYAPSLNLPRFARILGEKLNQLQYCTLDPFKKSLSGFFDAEMRYCPRCLEHAYHTFLFSLNGLSRCPIHNEPLLSTCPKCENLFETHLSNDVLFSPGKCRCGHVFLAKDFFRLKTLSDMELAPLSSLIHWSKLYLSKCDFSLIQPKNRQEWIKTFVSHSEVWSINGLPSLPSVIQTKPVIKKNDLFYIHHREPNRIINLSHSDAERPYTSIYKAIRRYITKTCLQNRTREYRILGAKAKISFNMNELAGDERKVYSFALVIWRKYIENWRKFFSLAEPHAYRFIHQRRWSFDLEQWRGPELPRHISDCQMLHWPRSSTAAEYEWAQWCFFAEDLLGFWWQVLSRVRDWVSSGQNWLDLYMEGPSPIASYSFVRDKGGGLTFVIQRADDASQNYNEDKECSGKASRKQNIEKQSQKKWNALLNKISAEPIILTYKLETGWSVERAHAPLAEDARNYKRRRLLIKGLRLYFILFRVDQYWIARCLELPLQTVGPTTADVVSMLKVAALQRAKLN